MNMIMHLLHSHRKKVENLSLVQYPSDTAKYTIGTNMYLIRTL